MSTEEIIKYKSIINGHDLEDQKVTAAIYDLIKSGLPPEALEKHRWELFNGTAEEMGRLLNFEPPFAETLVKSHATLMIPYPDHELSDSGFVRVRLYPPLQLEDKTIKYLQPKGVAIRPYIPDSVWNSRKDTTKPIIITEGEKKCILLEQSGYNAISVPGVFSFRNSGEENVTDLQLHSHLNSFKWANRPVYIAFDADFVANENVRLALFELGFRLECLGAVVKVLVWDQRLGKGIDDLVVGSDLPAQDEIASLINDSKPLLAEQFLSYSHEYYRGIAYAVRLQGDLEPYATTLAAKLGRTKASVLQDLKTFYRNRQNRTKALVRKNAEVITYSVQNNKMVRHGKNGQEIIADGYAAITTVYKSENGSEIYRIEGKTASGDQVSFRISAEDFADPKKLKIAFDTALGACASVAANMAAHIGPAITSATEKESIQYLQIYERTGWANIKGEMRFLIKGNSIDGVELQSDNKSFCYNLPETADLTKGLGALSALLKAHPPSVMTVAFTFIMQGPLSELVGWDDERYGLFIQGLTGSLKTACAQTLMSIWGPDFTLDSSLVRFGSGSTPNAIIEMATYPCNLPFLIDNFKYNTAYAKSVVSVIHCIIEGRAKNRLTKSAELKVAKPINSLPIITGEDLPPDDTSTLARILPLTVSWRTGLINTELKTAQDNSEHLSSIGRLWISFLESVISNKAFKRKLRSMFDEFRKKWTRIVSVNFPKMLNKTRVATNLASNELTWAVLSQIPELKPVLEQYAKAHTKGLMDSAAILQDVTSKANEAEVFLDTLREMVSSNRLDIKPNREACGRNAHNPDSKVQFDGWWEGSDLCVIPGAIFQKMDRDMGVKFGVSLPTLYQQLYEKGAFVSCDKGGTKTFRIPGRVSTRVLYLKSDYVQFQLPENDEPVIF